MEQSIYNTGAVPIREEPGAELADFETLFGMYRARVYRYALLSLRDPDLAENVTNDCFLRAHKARDQFRGDCPVATWLVRIATNLIRDTTRTRKFQFWKKDCATAVDTSLAAQRVASSELSPEASLLVKEKLATVWGAVEGLSARQRNVFLLRFVEEMELAEIVTATGMQLGTVKSHLHRALAAVRKAMEEAA